MSDLRGGTKKKVQFFKAIFLFIRIDRQTLCALTIALRSQAQQLRLPGGEISEGALYLSSDILQALSDGWPVVCAAVAGGQGEELLHARHLSRHRPQLVEGRTAGVEMSPVGVGEVGKFQCA